MVTLKLIDTVTHFNLLNLSAKYERLTYLISHIPPEKAVMMVAIMTKMDEDITTA